jgi:hypothetical protein
MDDPHEGLIYPISASSTALGQIPVRLATGAPEPPPALASGGDLGFFRVGILGLVPMDATDTDVSLD